MINLKNLKRNVMGIYKITFPNGKIYIGLSIDIKRRMWEHNNFKKAITPCDKAIVKYGKIEYIEILEYVNDADKLLEREHYWIKYFNSNKREIGYNLNEGGSVGYIGEKSGRATFSNSQVYDIRKRRFEGERKIDVYKTSYSKYSFGTFEKVWLGMGYPDVGKEFKIKCRDIREYSTIANSGENSRKAKLNNEMVLDIRKRFDSGESVKDIHKSYSFVSIGTVRRVCKRETWKCI